MNGQWFPDEYFDMQGWRNFFENTAAVQWNHRALTATLAATIATLAVYVHELRLPKQTRSAANAVWAAVVFQFCLGVVMLYEHVPTYMGAMHQATALLILSQIIRTVHTLRTPSPGPAAVAVAKAAGPASLAAAAAIAAAVTTSA